MMDKTTPLWRDERFWRIALQVLAVLVFAAFMAFIFGNASRNMTKSGIQFGFSFLNNAAGFNIGESVISYQPNDPYHRVLLAGLFNSLRVIILGIFLTTFLGVIAGIASFSDNWLVRQVNRVYVEVVRNTPLLLQLFFWYFVVFFTLPRPQDKIELPGPIFLSKRGITIPWPANTTGVWLWTAALIIGSIAAILIWKWRTQLMVEKAASGQPQLITLITLGIAAVFIILFGLGWQMPQLTATGEAIQGLNLSLEFSTILVGLVFYTGAFIAEIVRAGIQAVPKGQWEAANSLGLKSRLVLQLVIFPQALRVIIPPLNSQYINLAKNSSLATAIAYPDLYSVASTTYNQTGRPIEVFILMMTTYLLMNLGISFFMNFLNQVVQLKER